MADEAADFAKVFIPEVFAELRVCRPKWRS